MGIVSVVGADASTLYSSNAVDASTAVLSCLQLLARTTSLQVCLLLNPVPAFALTPAACKLKTKVSGFYLLIGRLFMHE